jgi:hypothetical protein
MRHRNRRRQITTGRLARPKLCSPAVNKTRGFRARSEQTNLAFSEIKEKSPYSLGARQSAGLTYFGAYPIISHYFP